MVCCRCLAEVRPFVGMPRQANSHDCGVMVPPSYLRLQGEIGNIIQVMVAASAEWILSQFLSGRKFPWDASGVCNNISVCLLGHHL